MYLAFYSEEMDLPTASPHYLLRVVQPQVQALQGVAKAELIGNKTFAMPTSGWTPGAWPPSG